MVRLVSWCWDWLTGRLVNWLFGWSTGRLMVWLVDWLTGRLVTVGLVEMLDWWFDKWLVDRCFDWSTSQLMLRLVDWWTGELMVRLVNWSTDCSIGGQVDLSNDGSNCRLVDCWTGRLLDWWFDWLTGLIKMYDRLQIQFYRNQFNFLRFEEMHLSVQLLSHSLWNTIIWWLALIIVYSCIQYGYLTLHVHAQMHNPYINISM